MFGLGKQKILESKLEIYEDLSKEMLDKLERAVSSIQENSNRVAIVLERHENRLDEGDRTNDAIMQVVKRVEERMEKIEKKTEENSKLLIIGAAIFTTVITIVQILPNLGLALTTSQASSIIPKVEAAQVNGRN
tara:strand:+ start:594 stop:995 length:402 start_codon:yes stop_codon:yes gene_type:complete